MLFIGYRINLNHFLGDAMSLNMAFSKCDLFMIYYLTDMPLTIAADSNIRNSAKDDFLL